jgi:flagellar M-ring protein FliF
LLTDKENQHSNSAKAGHITEAHDFGHEKTYQAAHSKEHFIREPGSIQRLTVSVVLPKDTPLATKFQVERLVKSSIGFNSQRGDLIAVEALMIEEPPVQPLQSLPKPAARPSNMVMSNFLSLMLGSLLLLCLLWHRHHVRLQRRASLRNALHQWMAEHD